MTLNELYQAISEQQTTHPDGFTILTGDFNHADPKFHQHVHFPTRGDNILDLVYTLHKGAYKAIPVPHISLPDHLPEASHRPIMLQNHHHIRTKEIIPILLQQLPSCGTDTNHHEML